MENCLSNKETISCTRWTVKHVVITDKILWKELKTFSSYQNVSLTEELFK